MSEKCDVSYKLEILRGVDLEVIPVQCHREAYRDGKCICHLDDPNKPLEPIIEEIRKLSHDWPAFHCSYFIFPKATFRFPVAIQKPAYFEHCTFYGDVDFSNSSFAAEASFRWSTFYGDTNFGPGKDMYREQTHFRKSARFVGSRFKSKADFLAAQFGEPPDFMATVFEGTANFAKAVVALRGSKDELKFYQTEFRDHAQLEIEVRGQKPRMSFHHCDLSGVRFGSLPRKTTQIDFVETANWYRKGRRIAIKDEDKSFKRGAVEIIDLYRYLESYFHEHSDYSLASHFYVGQMIARRRDKNETRFAKTANRLYQIVSNYGESIPRPMGWLVAMWLLIPMLLLFMGMELPTSEGPPVVTRVVNYDLTFDFGATPWTEWGTYYWTAFRSNIVLSTIQRSNLLSPPPASWQQVILVFETVANVILASLTVVAVRRKFSPKKPTGS